ncbi:MAG: DUF1844 domain-containing protein [Phycisphaerae bacterium]|jgi:hypothetical protein
MAENREQQDKPKIIVDDDWKAQAQAEKEKLDQQAAAAPDKGAAAAGPGAVGATAGPADQELPPASFATLVGQLVTQVFMALGGVEDPRTKKRYVDLALAKHHIDTMAMLEDKTKGNLTDEEKALLNQALYEARMHYVQIAQRV